MLETYDPAERNYHTGDRELLAIMKALKKWRQYLMATRPFKIWTDHHNLTYFQKPQNINRRQAGWIQKCRNTTSLFITWKANRMSKQMHCQGEREKKTKKRITKMLWFSLLNCLKEWKSLHWQ